MRRTVSAVGAAREDTRAIAEIRRRANLDLGALLIVVDVPVSGGVRCTVAIPIIESTRAIVPGPVVGQVKTTAATAT